MTKLSAHCCACAGADLGRLCRGSCEGMYCDDHLRAALRSGVLDEDKTGVGEPPSLPATAGLGLCEVCRKPIPKEKGSPGRPPKTCSSSCKKEKLRRYHRKRNAERRKG